MVKNLFQKQTLGKGDVAVGVDGQIYRIIDLEPRESDYIYRIQNIHTEEYDICTLSFLKR